MLCLTPAVSLWSLYVTTLSALTHLKTCRRNSEPLEQRCGTWLTALIGCMIVCCVQRQF